MRGQIRPYDKPDNRGKDQLHERLDLQPHPETPRPQTTKGGRLRQELRHERKALPVDITSPSRGHAATGAFLCNRSNKPPSDRC